MKIAFLTTDNREHHRRYDLTEPYFGTAPEALLEGFSMLPSEIEVHVVSCTQQPMVSPEELTDNIWYHSLHVPKIGWLRTGYLGCIRATRTLLCELRPDIVHGQGTERDCAISAVFSGFPNVITLHGNMRLIAVEMRASPFSFQWIAARLEGFTVPRSNGVVCLTRYSEAAVRPLARRTWVVPNAVDPSFFEILRTPDPDPLILCVGTICPRKNQNAFIRALDNLAARREIRVVFLGDANWKDPYAAEFKSLIASRKWCEFTGFAKRDALRECMSRARLLALPSIEDNCPMTLLEAAAAGVPVLAANVGGIPDMIHHEDTGLLCDPADESSMAHGVERLISDQRFSEAIWRNARAQAQEKFQPKVVAKRHLEIYCDVLSTFS